MTRSSRLCGAAVVMGMLCLAGCESRATAPETAAAAVPETPAAGAHPEQALLEDLTVANRILGRDLAILDIQGHTSVRSRLNPNHWYMPRFVSPGGASVGDMIEYDLDSKEVHGPRTDNAREIYLHGEIYKARPDVMAIVHSHTPEFVAFGVSSVPLWSGTSRLPVFDLRPFNRGRSGIIGTPALGREMARALGREESILLWGHGIALTAASLPDAVSRVDELRDTARRQQAAIAMGVTWTPRPRAGNDRHGTSQQAWEYYRQAVLKDTEGRVPASPEPTPEKPSDPDRATTHDLVLANRILASADLGILDALGHVSVRNPRNPNAYFVAPRVGAGAVTAADVIQRDLTAAAADDRGLTVHDEIYKARPDVMAVLYARTPEIVAFAGGPVALRPVVNGGAFIGDGLPVFEIGGVGPGQSIFANPTLARGVAQALGRSTGVLLEGHGFVLATSTIYNLVDRAYALRQNATIQQQALALRGRVSYLNERPVAPEPPNERPQPAPRAPTGPAEGRAWIYWSQNVSLD